MLKKLHLKAKHAALLFIVLAVSLVGSYYVLYSSAATIASWYPSDQAALIQTGNIYSGNTAASIHNPQPAQTYTLQWKVTLHRPTAPYIGTASLTIHLRVHLR